MWKKQQETIAAFDTNTNTTFILLHLLVLSSAVFKQVNSNHRISFFFKQEIIQHMQISF